METTRPIFRAEGRNRVSTRKRGGGGGKNSAARVPTRTARPRRSAVKLRVLPFTACQHTTSVFTLVSPGISTNSFSALSVYRTCIKYSRSGVQADIYSISRYTKVLMDFSAIKVKKAGLCVVLFYILYRSLP